MATINDVLNFSRKQSQSDSISLTDTNGIIFANEALYDFHRRLVDGGIDASQVQEAYRDGAIPNPGEGSVFLYPANAMFLKTIEVNYSDSEQSNYIRASQIDVSNLPGQNSFSWLRKNASTQSPQFDDRGDMYEIFPSFVSGNNLTNAIRLFYFLKPTEYSSTSDTIAYPVSIDYRIIGWRICANFYYSLNKFLEGDKFNIKYEERVIQLIRTLGRGSQQPIQSQVLNVGNNGWQF